MDARHTTPQEQPVTEAKPYTRRERQAAKTAARKNKAPRERFFVTDQQKKMLRKGLVRPVRDAAGNMLLVYTKKGERKRLGK